MKTRSGVLTSFLASFSALLVLGGKCTCQTYRRCVDVFFIDVVLYVNLTTFEALVVFCGKCKCTNSHWCVDVFFDIISISFLALLVFGGKCMRQNSQGCVDVFFRVIFGVSGLRWEMNV